MYGHLWKLSVTLNMEQCSPLACCVVDLSICIHFHMLYIGKRNCDIVFEPEPEHGDISNVSNVLILINNFY